MKKIAVVILNWNGKDLLEKFLPSVLAYSSEANIYVADNASTDASLSMVSSQFPEIKIIHNKKNFGFAQGYNEALHHVQEPYLALVNSDIEVTPNWLTPIFSIFENNPNTAIIQPKILDYKKKTHFEYAGAGGGYIDQYGYAFCRGRIFDTIEEDLGQYNDTTSIFWASGACFFIRKSVFNNLGGFDNDFFAHQEEIDLCWRALNQGFQIQYCGISTVYHVGGATLQEGNPQKTYLNFRNSLLMLTKNLPSNKLFPILFLRLFLDGIAGVNFLFQRKFSHIYAIIKAHFSFYILLFKMLKKRGDFQQHDYFKVNSIVYLYFIKKGKVFASLF
jgi:GT2 family glycosyltransferase